MHRFIIIYFCNPKARQLLPHTYATNVTNIRHLVNNNYNRCF